MQTRDYLKYIVDEIHSTVFAIVDEKGCPVTCAIDMMDCDESGLYFLTAKGKKFYERLKANENIAFTAMRGEDTLSCVAVPVQGTARKSVRWGPSKRAENRNRYCQGVESRVYLSQKELLIGDRRIRRGCYE